MSAPDKPESGHARPLGDPPVATASAGTPPPLATPIAWTEARLGRWAIDAMGRELSDDPDDVVDRVALRLEMESRARQLADHRSQMAELRSELDAARRERDVALLELANRTSARLFSLLVDVQTAQDANRRLGDALARIDVLRELVDLDAARARVAAILGNRQPSQDACDEIAERRSGAK